MITVIISSNSSIDLIHQLKYINLSLDQVVKVTPDTQILDFLNNIDYLEKLRHAKLVIVKDAHLIFPKKDFNLKVILGFLNLNAELWLLVPQVDLLHDLVLESVSRVKEINQTNSYLSYDNSLSWVTDDLALCLSRGQSFIFWGESGVGKTTMAMELARAMNGTVISSRCFDLVHGSVGDSEKELENLFKKARDAQPSVLVLDDLDTLFKNRNDSGDLALKMVTQLMIELDEIQFYNLSILFLGTAVNIQDLDESLWKGGRCITYHVKKSI